MRLNNMLSLTLTAACLSSILTGCGTLSKTQSTLTLPASQSSTTVDKGLYVLPPVKSTASLPDSTTDAYEAYGVCVIDFNALRVSKGLLGEAARVVEKERDTLDKLWDEDFRKAWEKAQD